MAKGGRGFKPGFGSGLLAGSVATSGGSGGALVGACRSTEDNSFYCQLTRFTSIVSQLVKLAVIAFIIYFGIQMLRGKK